MRHHPKCGVAKNVAPLRHPLSPKVPTLNESPPPPPPAPPPSPPRLSLGIHIVSANKRVGSGPYERYATVRREKRGQWQYETTGPGSGLPVLGTVIDMLQSGDEIRRIEGTPPPLTPPPLNPPNPPLTPPLTPHLPPPLRPP